MSESIGFDVNEDIETSDLVCCICLEIYTKPVDTDCNHTFCLHCIKTSIEFNGKSCPHCRTSLATRKRPNSGYTVIGSDVIVKINRGLSQRINQLEMKCDFQSNGCNEKIKYPLKTRHLNACPFRWCLKCGLLLPHNCVDLLKRSLNRLETQLMNKNQEILDLKNTCKKKTAELIKFKLDAIKKDQIIFNLKNNPGQQIDSLRDDLLQTKVHNLNLTKQLNCYKKKLDQLNNL